MQDRSVLSRDTGVLRQSLPPEIEIDEDVRININNLMGEDASNISGRMLSKADFG